MEWQPIETAPKDGTRVLIAGGTWYDDSETFRNDYPLLRADIAWFVDDEWCMGTSDAHDEFCWANPTHWMPLPEPPE